MKIELKDFIDDGDNILACVSGGADSMCLLSLLAEYNKKHKFSLTAVHINHSLRGKEADGDQKLVEDFAKANNIKCITRRVDAKAYCKKVGKTIEEGARELRYKEILKIKEETKANKIFTAHNKGDQAETVLMHIARGSGLAGAEGMPEKGKVIYRPLLRVSKEEIVEYCKQNRIPFSTDSSNLSTKYARNFIRLEILPKLKEIYSGVEDSLCNFASFCQVDENYIESTLPKDVVVYKEDEVLLKDKLCVLHPAVQIRLFRNAIRGLNVYSDTFAVHYKALLNLFEKKSGASLALPHELSAHRVYDGVVIEKNKKEKEELLVPFKVGSSFSAGKKISVSACERPKKFEAGKTFIDLDKIPEGCVFRFKKEGDVFQKIGSKGKKKFADYLTDKKVEKRKRENIVVLANNKEILCAINLDVSEKVKVDENSKRIAKIEVL